MDDHKLAPRSIRQAECQKKNSKFGWVSRHLLLGYTQIIVARDKEFAHIVNVIPIVGGFISVSRENENMIRILTSVREFRLRFVEEGQAEVWFNDILALSGSKVLEQTDLKKIQPKDWSSQYSTSDIMKEYK